MVSLICVHLRQACSKCFLSRQVLCLASRGASYFDRGVELFCQVLCSASGGANDFDMGGRSSFFLAFPATASGLSAAHSSVRHFFFFHVFSRVDHSFARGLLSLVRPIRKQGLPHVVGGVNVVVTPTTPCSLASASRHARVSIPVHKTGSVFSLSLFSFWVVDNGGC